jgi:ribonuclease P protein component
MLRKENRLRKTKEFREVAGAKKGVRQKGLLLKVGASREGVSRVGIVVSKKVAKQAVRRNRIRRVLREAVKREFEVREPRADIVLIVLPEFELSEAKEAERAVHQLFQKASLFQ